MTGPADLTIAHDAARHHFEVLVDGQRCVLDYTLADTVMTITHTGVPEAVGGRGIAAQLLGAAVAAARGAGWRIVPACSYAAAYFRRHAELRDLLA